MASSMIRLFRQWKDGKYHFWGIAKGGYVKTPEVETKTHDELTPFKEVNGKDVFERDICIFTSKNEFGSLFSYYGVVIRGENGDYGFVNDLGSPALLTGSMTAVEKVGDVYTTTNLLSKCLKNPEEWLKEEMGQW